MPETTVAQALINQGPAMILAVGAFITALAGAWVVIRQTKATAVTVDQIAANVDGTLSELKKKYELEQELVFDLKAQVTELRTIKTFMERQHDSDMATALATPTHSADSKPLMDVVAIHVDEVDKKNP